MNDDFEKNLNKSFRFLIDDFQAQIIDTEKNNYGCIVWYKNNTTVVRVSLELYDGGMFVTVYKLKNGAIPDFPIFFNPADEFLIFDLNDLLIIRTGKQIEVDGDLLYDAKYLGLKVQEFAEALKNSASDVLAGNFDILPLIKRRVAARSRELEDES